MHQLEVLLHRFGIHGKAGALAVGLILLAVLLVGAWLAMLTIQALRRGRTEVASPR